MKIIQIEIGKATIGNLAYKGNLFRGAGLVLCSEITCYWAWYVNHMLYNDTMLELEHST